jgi:hypothetical protein
VSDVTGGPNCCEEGLSSNVSASKKKSTEPHVHSFVCGCKPHNSISVDHQDQAIFLKPFDKRIKSHLIGSRRIETHFSIHCIPHP